MKKNDQPIVFYTFMHKNNSIFHRWIYCRTAIYTSILGEIRVVYHRSGASTLERDREREGCDARGPRRMLRSLRRTLTASCRLRRQQNTQQLRLKAEVEEVCWTGRCAAFTPGGRGRSRPRPLLLPHVTSSPTVAGDLPLSPMSQLPEVLHPPEKFK